METTVKLHDSCLEFNSLIYIFELLDVKHLGVCVVQSEAVQGQDFSAVVNASSQNDELEHGQATSFTKRDGAELRWDEMRWGENWDGNWGLGDQGLLLLQGHGCCCWGRPPAYQWPSRLPQQWSFQTSSTGNRGSWVVLLSTTVALAIVCFLCSSFDPVWVFLTPLKGLLRCYWVLFQAHVMPLNSEVFVAIQGCLT